MNYRHHFHAGNFADLVKHALWLALLRKATVRPGPITVIDTHAGAGLYDLLGEAAQRSGEAEQGVVRLMADEAAPALFELLKAAVRLVNPEDGLRYYPGSPALTWSALRKRDSWEGCELRPDDRQTLASLAADHFAAARVLQADGYAHLAGARPKDRLIALIDPPFEQPDDYRRILRPWPAAPPRTTVVLAAAEGPRNARRLHRGAGDAGQRGFVAEVRLQPLSDPMKMNGCAVAVLGVEAAALEAEAMAIADWVAATADRTDRPN